MTNSDGIINSGWNLDHSYARLPKIFFSTLEPNPVRSPAIVKLNSSLALSLGLNGKTLQTEEGVEILAGNKVPEEALLLAQAYAGHQFGHFNRLGDGRAMLLGEQLTPQGERMDIQYKGSGRTPYSRGGDGRAGLGPMLREYIISEAMHSLGIPTTRSLAVVTTGETIIREENQPGAILTRVASSHLRVGTFQYAAQWASEEELRALADYAIDRHYPDAKAQENPYLFLLQEVIKRQAELIAKWQLIGFIHGVMNTDNMTISGETIDYGPCAFMDVYDPATVFSSIDREGRYAYGNQPYIGGWNLARFAESLVPLLHDTQEKAVEMAQDALSDYSRLYKSSWLKGMRAKLGLINEEEQDEALIQDLLGMMKKYGADYTNTFRWLSFDKQKKSVLFGTEEFTKWFEQWQARLGRQENSQASSKQLMQNSNPAVIPRNHLVEEALDAAVEEGDYSVMESLLDVLSKPYAHELDEGKYCSEPPDSNRPYQTYCGT
ncbi:protein adenylyltransferase SelO [Sutcliffiella deserti]|uniref:protein adenylyltransferase SelO n=1 Tax=Sutcliffiella deserti TaxID=2875501 RepID=UPI001CBF1C9D|nr:YdiU family protein [Sutcliffiella deserti]